MRRFIFIHINKTGGSSIACAVGIPQQEHSTASEIRNKITAEQWQESFKFAFVRNPWDRVVSHYHYRLQTNQAGLSDGNIGFNEWVRRAYGIQDTAFYDNPRFFMPQTNWIVGESGSCIVDYVGRFENLTHDFGEVSNILGLTRKLPHIRQTSHGHYQQYYEEDTVEIIYKWFLIDVENFGYQF